MSISLADDVAMMELSNIKNSITVTEEIVMRSYTCDCTGCSNGCYESCADGNGSTN